MLPIGGAVLFHNGRRLPLALGVLPNPQEQGRKPRHARQGREGIGGQVHQNPRRQQPHNAHGHEHQGQLAPGQLGQLLGILPGHGPGILGGEAGKGIGHFRLLGLDGSVPFLLPDGVPLIPEAAQLPHLFLGLHPGRQRSAQGLHLAEGFLGLGHGISGLGYLHRIGSLLFVGQGLPVIIQLLEPGLHVLDPLPELFRLDVQRFQLGELLIQLLQLGLRLGKQTGFVVAAFVPQILQLIRQPIRRAAFVAGGDEGVEPAPQSLVLGHGQVGKADEARPAVHRLLHAQKPRPAVGGIQLLHGKAGGSLVGLEFSQGHPPLGAALDGDVPAVPVQVDPAGHGASGPGLVALLVRKSRLCALGPGVQAVEHGKQKGAPGAFAPLVGGSDDIQAWLQGQCLMLQLAEGGRHFVNSHSLTSLPSRIFREISAARVICRAFSGFSVRASWSNWK